MNANANIPSAVVESERTVTARAISTTGARALVGRLSEPHVLFPLLAFVVLSFIWGATFNLVRVERRNAESAAAAAGLEFVSTYQAQMVRALREIDQTLKVVQYAYETRGAGAALDDLKLRALLPPALLFVVRIVDHEGKIKASTEQTDLSSPSLLAIKAAHDAGDKLWIDQPRRDLQSRDWKLQFGRRLPAPDGEADEVVVSVDASYFVSGYDAAHLGRRGFLGLLGTDGVFRARRTGEAFSAGEAVEYSSVVSDANPLDPSVALAVNSWDGIRRYTATQQLYEFPLAVIVGLSQDEQLAAARHNAHTYFGRAGMTSALLLLLATLLGRLSWQLARARERETQAHLDHAKQVEYLAYHDALTGLPNRSLFSKLLESSISESKRYERRLAVAFLDLDRFKQINDTLGHEAGDQLLKEVATRLKGCIRESDTIARLGGDEFVVLLPDLKDEKYVSIVARKILETAATPFSLMGQDCRVSASIGICTYPRDGHDEQTLTKNADIAMYQAKAEGKNNFQFYSEKLNANSLQRLTLESSLRRALEHDEFRLHYQAKRDISSGKITGMEALLRWEHPDLGTIAPMRFIPVAEESGLIVPIGKWVLRTACLQSANWRAQGLPVLSIAVNMTARQFLDEQMLTDVASILSETGMDPRLLEIEVNEGILMRDVENTRRILSGLKALGVRIAVDDFGTGYASLALLQRFPLDTIKIDRSFVRDFVDANENTELADAIIAMGKSLSLTVVAQGVETKEQAEHLRMHACDELQGFYFKMPLPVDEFTRLLREQVVTGMAVRHENPESVAADGLTEVMGLK